MCVCVVTFQCLVDVVVQVVDSQAVLETGWVFLDPVGHYVDRYVTVVLLHLTQEEGRILITFDKMLISNCYG